MVDRDRNQEKLKGKNDEESKIHMTAYVTNLFSVTTRRKKNKRAKKGMRGYRFLLKLWILAVCNFLFYTQPFTWPFFFFHEFVRRKYFLIWIGGNFVAWGATSTFPRDLWFDENEKFGQDLCSGRKSRSADFDSITKFVNGQAMEWAIRVYISSENRFTQYQSQLSELELKH